MRLYDNKQQGYVHSVETGGMVDGPGIRYVVFFAGCSLRCKYCHNPDTWNLKSGQLVTVEDVVRDIKKYLSYLKYSGGGVTITGGEPFVQPGFLVQLLAACKAAGLHTVLDTSGNGAPEVALRALQNTDLLILDIKSINPQVFKDLTKGELDKTLEVLEISKALKVPVWIRYVLVPGYTDDINDIQNLANYLKHYDNIEKIEVLPFHKMGEYKWKNLNLPYELKDVQPPDSESLKKAKKILGITK